jgi:hypothetical protein
METEMIVAMVGLFGSVGTVMAAAAWSIKELSKRKPIDPSIVAPLHDMHQDFVNLTEAVHRVELAIERQIGIITQSLEWSKETKEAVDELRRNNCTPAQLAAVKGGKHT